MTDIRTIAAALADHEIALRPISTGDMGLLARIYASTRQEELAVTGWGDAQKEAFLLMQFNAQHSYYQQHYPSAAFLIVLREGRPAGRLYLDRRQDELRIVDIALLPERRGRGLGTSILTAILAEGQRLGLPVRIHVERFNPALRLYTRLGFRRVADGDIYYLMEKAADAG